MVGGAGKQGETLPLRLSPSAAEPVATARIGEVLELGERIAIEGDFDPAILGWAIHAVIATKVQGQNATERILDSYGLTNTLSVENADLCAHRFLDFVREKFTPERIYAEFPIQYTNEYGQLVGGWIDLLLETEEGIVLIDHKASPRARSEWEEIGLGYSGQLGAYSQGIARVTGKQVLSSWINFAVTGGFVEIVSDQKFCPIPTGQTR